MQTRTTAIVIAAVATLSVLAPATPAKANPKLLKSNVVTVRPQYHAKTKRAFESYAIKWAREALRLQKKQPQLAEGLAAVAQRFAQHARGAGHGTGWLWMPASTNAAFIVTNKHVAGQAESVVIEFDNNRHPAITGNSVIYVDPIVDIAVIEVPRDRLPHDATGFELIEQPLTEGNPVWAAGFPGTATNAGYLAAWSLTNGIVSNAEYPGIVGGAVAHTASIDPGNSGGPLLTEVPTAALGYKVSGINTWKVLRRTNVNLSIPAATIAQVLKAALESRKLARQPSMLASSLKATAKKLAVELGSSRPDMMMLSGLIAYSFVAERPGLLGLPVEQARAGRISEDGFLEFLNSPVEFTRKTIWVLFFEVFSTGKSKLGDVKLEAINDTISTDRPVRSMYSIAGKRQEIFWVWEHGAWRISDASFENAIRLAPKSTTDFSKTVDAKTKTGAKTTVSKRAKPSVPATNRRGYSFRLGFATSSASDDNFSSTLGESDGRSLALDVNIPLSRRLSFVTGLGYIPHGAKYSLDAGGSFVFIQEELRYLQIPALARLTFGHSGTSLTANVFGKAGLALDVRVSAGGTFNGGDLADVDYYKKQNSINVAAVYGGGIEFGLGADPAWLVGVELTRDHHLLDEWIDSMFFNEENYRYSSSRVGLSLRYEPR